MFLDTKHAVDRLTKHLLNSGVRAAALHGGKSQPQRTRTLAQFKTGHVTVLVATNVAARGIHVDNLDLVVNVDPPSDHKDYLHRGGRTARAGESGSVVTLVTPNQRREMSRLMAAAGITPQTTQVRSGEAELSRITGAQAPSGVPVVITAPVVERPRRGASSSSRGRRGRTGGKGRSTGEARRTPQRPSASGGLGPGRAVRVAGRSGRSPGRRVGGTHPRRRAAGRACRASPGAPALSALIRPGRPGSPLHLSCLPPHPSLPCEASCAASSPGSRSTSTRAGCWTR